jgi:hypothetical protein
MTLAIRKNYLVVLFFLLCAYSSIAQQNSLGLKISKLESKYTSGGGSAPVKGTVTVTMLAPSNIEVTLQYRSLTTGGTWSDFNKYTGTAGGGTEVLVANLLDLNIRTEIYCFRMTAVNKDNQRSTSKEICTIPFRIDPVLSSDGKPIIHMASYQPSYSEPFRPFITSKCLSDFGCTDDTDDFVTKTQVLAPYEARKELNARIKCGETKIMQISIMIDNTTITSDTIHFIGLTKNKPASILKHWAYATVTNDQVQIRWYNDDVKNDNYTVEKYFVLERKDGPNAQFVTLTTPELQRKPGERRTEWTYTDLTSKPTEIGYEYKLSYFDYCGNQSIPIPVTPIHLQQAQSYDLFWNKHVNDDIYEYEIEFYDISTAPAKKLVTKQYNENTLELTEAANFYRIRAKLREGDESIIYSNFLENAEKLKVLNPTVFTPDSQGPDQNNSFKVFVRGQYTFSMNIYDRYGVLMYTSDNYDLHKEEGWKGKVLNMDTDAPEGVYAFEVRVTNRNRNSFTKRGSFLLIRK